MKKVDSFRDFTLEQLGEVRGVACQPSLRFNAARGVLFVCFMLQGCALELGYGLAASKRNLQLASSEKLTVKNDLEFREFRGHAT